MFGLEKKHGDEEIYDLEKECKVSSSASERKNKILGKIEKLKNLIRQGSSSEDFAQMETLLQGYVALQRIVTRIK